LVRHIGLPYLLVLAAQWLVPHGRCHLTGGG
jgi:hypothetical protein